MNKKTFVEFTERCRWRFAETYKDSGPHFYIVRDKLPEERRADFFSAVRFIRSSGFEANFYQLKNHYFIEGDWYYWTMGYPVKETEIINRARLVDYILFRRAWFWLRNPATGDMRKLT